MIATASLAAVARLTLREAMRQRLWLLFAAAAVAVMIVGLQLGAVDGANRLKLAVVGITAAISFVVILLAVLVGAAQVRRDLDARVAFLLFAKPMPRLSYLLGRWSGVQAVLFAGIVALSLVGTLMVQLTFERLPVMRAVNAPTEWVEVTPLGETIAITEGSNRKALAGAPGGAMRWTLRNLPIGDVPQDGLDLFVRCQVRSIDAGLSIEECLVQISATPTGGQPRLLTLAKSSPYGFGTDGAIAGEGQVVLRHRDQLRSDYTQDFAHLKLPADCIGADGATVVQITRLDSRVQLVVTKSNSVRVARDGGSLAANLIRGGLVLLASAAMLTAFTLLIGTLSNLGVTLLGGLALFFAGSVLWTIEDTLTYEKMSTPAQRVLELVQLLLPDFERFQVAAKLAAGQAIAWDAVAAAWIYFGAYTLGFLLLAWIALVRKEM